MVTFTGRQASMDDPDARRNELTQIEQQYFAYPASLCKAQKYLRWQSEKGRDVYYGVHLFQNPGSRLASNSVPTVSCLWLDEDEGSYPSAGPEPTAIVNSSAERRHLYWRLTYWRLTRPISVEKAVELNRRIAHWGSGDIGKAGLASVLRPPETSNYKRHPIVDDVRGTITGVVAWEPEVLEQAIPLLPEPEIKPGYSGSYDGPPVDLADYLAGVEVLYDTPDTLSGTKYAIVCPWVNEHSGGDRSGTYVGQRIDGGPWFHCNHDHCIRAGRTWRDFRDKVRPGFASGYRRQPKVFSTHKEVINRGI